MGKYLLPQDTNAKSQMNLLQNMVWAFQSVWFGWGTGNPQKYEEFLKNPVDLDDITRCPVCCRKRRKSRAKVIDGDSEE